jgi:hypothetical protein
MMNYISKENMRIIDFTSILLILCLNASCSVAEPPAADAARTFDAEKDLLSLHYDHADDRDDGQSAAADRTMLQVLNGVEWISKHVIPVSGAYGKNARLFNPDSDAVMDVCWNDCGGWLAGHDASEAVLSEMTVRWSRTLRAGGHIWVKEGGQSDITSACDKGQVWDSQKRIESSALNIHATERRFGALLLPCELDVWRKDEPS